MANQVFNVALGAAAEKVRDGATNLLMLVLRTTNLESDAGIKDRDTLDDLLVTGTSDEPTNAGYARKTGLTGTLTVDDTNDRVDLDIPDQTWVGVAAGDAWSRLVIAYQESAAETGRIPLTSHDFVITPDGTDVTAVIAAAGFYRAS